jgi:hypothetical protein
MLLAAAAAASLRSRARSSWCSSSSSSRSSKGPQPTNVAESSSHPQATHQQQQQQQWMCQLGRYLLPVSQWITCQAELMKQTESKKPAVKFWSTLPHPAANSACAGSLK